VTNLWATSVGMSLLAVVSSMGDRLQLVFAWQANEIAGSDVDALVDEVTRQCEALKSPADMPPTAVAQAATSGADH
jgi:hypothetical protein